MRRDAKAVLGVMVFGLCAAGAHADPGADRALRTANGLLERGLAQEAIPEYRQALDGLESSQARDEARYGLALSLFRTRAYEESLGAIESLEQPEGFGFAADAASLRAHTLHRLGRYSDAASAFSEFASGYPDHSGWSGAAALAVECAHRAGEHRDATRLASRFNDRLEGTADGRRALFFAAASASARGRHEDAAESFEKLADGSADDMLTQQSMIRLARAFESLGRQGEALRAYERTARSATGAIQRDGIIGFAVAQRQQGKFEEASKLLADLRKDHPRHRPERVALELAISQFELGRTDEAELMLRGVEQNKDLLDDASYWTARVESSTGRHTQAASRLSDALERFEKSPLRSWMMFDLASALERAGRADDALDAFGEFRAEHPKHEFHADALHAEASILLNKGESQAAADRATEMLRGYPDHELAPETAFILGEAEYREGRTGRAAGAFALLLERLKAQPELVSDPDLLERARYRLGMSLHAEGRSDEAAPVLREVTDGVSTDPRFVPALAALGDKAFSNAAWEQAVSDYGAFLRVSQDREPDSSQVEDVTMRLALAHSRLDRHDEAITLYESIAGGDGAHAPHALFELGQSLVATGRDGEASDRFNELLQREPGSRFEGHTLRHLGSIAMRQGKHAEAEGYLARAGEELGEDLDDAAILMQRARALIELDRADEAVGILGKPRRDEPSEQTAWRIIALARDGQHEQVAQAFGRARNDEDLDETLRGMLEFEVARSLVSIGRDSDAEQLLSAHASSGSPIGAHATLELAGILNDREEYSEAQSLLTDLLTWDGLPATVCAPALYRAAWSAHQLGDHRAVVTLLDAESRQCGLGDLTAAAEMLYGESLLTLGRAREAAERFSIIVSEHPSADDAATAMLRLGDSHAASQSWNDSARAYTDFLESNTSSPLWFRARFGLGWAIENGGDPRAAIEHYRLVTDRHQGETAARAQFQIGECLFALGSHEEAVRELLRVDILHAEPKWSAAALYEAGRCFEAMGKVGEARAQYRDVLVRFEQSDWAAASRERLAALTTGRVPGRGGDD